VQCVGPCRSRPSGRKPLLAPLLVTASSQGEGRAGAPLCACSCGRGCRWTRPSPVMPASSVRVHGSVSRGPWLVIGGDEGGIRPGPSSATAGYPTNQMAWASAPMPEPEPHCRPPGRRLIRPRPQIRRDNPLNLSMLLSGGKETNKDSLSSGGVRPVTAPWRRGPVFSESRCLGMQPKVGGKLHLRLNTGTRRIVDKYLKGKLKITLKREFNRARNRWEVNEWGPRSLLRGFKSAGQGRRSVRGDPLGPLHSVGRPSPGAFSPLRCAATGSRSAWKGSEGRWLVGSGRVLYNTSFFFF